MIYYTCGFYFTEDYKYVLLIEKARPDWQKGKYNGVGGHVEHGELPYDAQVREFKEETGFEKYIDWESTHSLVSDDAHIFFYKTTGPKFDVDAFFPGGDEKPRWIPVSAIDNYNIIPNLSWTIRLLASKCGVFEKFDLIGSAEAYSRWDKDNGR